MDAPRETLSTLDAIAARTIEPPHSADHPFDLLDDMIASADAVLLHAARYHLGVKGSRTYTGTNPSCVFGSPASSIATIDK